MVKRLFFLVPCLMALPASALDVVNLRTEDYHNPVGIDRSTIHLSWQLQSEQRGVLQASYSLQIASDAAFGNVVWESGVVNSDQSVDVEANGFNPASETRYYWRVTVSDNKGEVGTSTEKAYFETGLMNESGWNGTHWIKATTNAPGTVVEGPITDYEVEVKFNIKSLAAGLIFAASDHNNYYMWQVNTLTGSPRFRPHRWSGGNPACLSENAITQVNITNNEQHTMKIVVTNANTARTYIDGILINTSEGDFAYGDFGFREDYDNGNVPEQAFFDDFVVKSGDKILLEEHFDGSTCMFSSGTLEDGQFYLSGPGTYSWQQVVAKQVRFDVDFDFTLVQDNASICFSATSSDTYMMWAINTFDVSQPVVRRHVYKNGNLTYNDTPITAFSKADIINHQRHIRIECETPYVRTYIDNVLVDTYQDTQGVLAVGDLGMRVSATGNEREKAYFDNIKQTVYNDDGTTHVTINEDFEGAGNAFNGEVKEFGGSRQCYMEAAVGSSKRLMQQEGSITPGVPIFRKTFDLDSGVRRARLYATGLGVYNVFINGERVGQTDEDGNTLYDELKPGATEMFKTVFYTTHDVTALLQEGKNAIGAEVSSGWWNGAIVHGTYGNKPNAFRALLKIELEDGSTKVIPTDLSWLSNTNGPLRKGDIYNGETYDARLEAGQFTPDYDDSNWFAVAASNDFKGEILAFEGPSIMAVESLRRFPQTIQIYEGIKSNGKTFGEINVVEEISGQNNFSLAAGQTAVIDLGQNGSGWVSFTAKGARGTKLHFRFGEMPNTTGDRSRGDDGPAGSVYTENLRSAEATLYYTLKGAEDGESFHPTTTYFGFRYIEVTSSSDVELTSIIGETVTSAVDEKSSFHTSHEDVNKLYSNIMWGQRSNFVSVPTDCPQRDERMGWTADTQVYSMAGLYNGDTRNFYKKWMRDMRDAQREDGAYGVIAPYHWQVGYGAAAWADAGVIVPWYVYLMTGDKDILRDNLAANEKYMAFLAAQTGDGYLYNGGYPTYGDWVSYANTDSRYCSVCYYAYVADLMGRTYRALSEQEGDSYSKKAEQYEQLFENIKAEWQSRYLATNKTPNQATQCGFLMALHYNLLPDATSISRTRTRLRSAISSNGYKLNTGFLGTAILNQTLTENGLNDEAYTLLLQRNDPSWLYSIDQGATTIWERWNSYTVANGYGPVSMNSFNHYAYGIIAEWMFRHMAGIAPDEQQPGFKHFLLQPNTDTRSILRYSQKRITSVDADFASDYGSIKAEWQCEGTKEMTYRVTIPANTSATLRLPVAEGLYIYESGELAEEADGVEYIGTADGYAIYEVGSGSYLFVVSTEEPVGIKNVQSSNMNVETEGQYFNLAGIRFPDEASARGIVITNGKKVAIK